MAFLTKETQCSKDIPIPLQLLALLFSIPWGNEANYFCADISDRHRQHAKLTVLVLALHPCQEEEFPGISIIIKGPVNVVILISLSNS